MWTRGILNQWTMQKGSHTKKKATPKTLRKSLGKLFKKLNKEKRKKNQKKKKQNLKFKKNLLMMVSLTVGASMPQRSIPQHCRYILPFVSSSNA